MIQIKTDIIIQIYKSHFQINENNVFTDLYFVASIKRDNKLLNKYINRTKFTYKL